jgi:branched-chain amino acid transport system substrate-binding protein
MRRVSFALAVLTMVSLILSVTACGPAEQAGETIKIGVIAELTGELGNLGQAAVNGVELAVAEVNDAGGVRIGGKMYRLELIVEDSEGRENVAIAAAQKLIDSDGVMAIIQADRSEVAIAASWIAENSKTVLIGPSIASPDFTVDPNTREPKSYVFRTTFTGDFQGRALALFALSQLGTRRVAVLYDSDSAYNRSIAESFKESVNAGISEALYFMSPEGAPLGELASYSGEVVAFENYSTGEMDFSAQLNRIKAANPDVLFLPNFLYDIPEQAKQARAMGIDVPLLGAEMWANAELLAECGSACEGAYLTTDFRPEIPNEAATQFVADYAVAYGMPPGSVAALCYDATHMLALGLERGDDVDREALREGLVRLPRYNGVTGSIDYHPDTGDPQKPANVMQIRDGKFVWIANVDAQ